MSGSCKVKVVIASKVYLLNSMDTMDKYIKQPFSIRLSDNITIWEYQILKNASIHNSYKVV